MLVGGSAGDFTSLSVDERLAIAEAVLDQSGGKVGVVLGAQSANQGLRLFVKETAVIDN